MRGVTLLLLFIFFASGCQKEEKKDISIKEGISIEDSWIRPGVQERNTAAFMKILNGTDFEDTLISASSDLAKVVEIHETFTRENDLKGMRQIDHIIIPPNSVTELKPNGLHIMLIGLEQDLRGGDEGQVTLWFKTAGERTINAKVK
ncbi:MAG: copper chaperone PCu(A)C [Melioribacteraceae bacterium]|nr:copper chaperone PCu(A)C [Melioribacteraceae bacterium]